MSVYTRQCCCPAPGCIVIGVAEFLLAYPGWFTRRGDSGYNTWFSKISYTQTGTDGSSKDFGYETWTSPYWPSFNFSQAVTNNTAAGADGYYATPSPLIEYTIDAYNYGVYASDTVFNQVSRPGGPGTTVYTNTWTLSNPISVTAWVDAIDTFVNSYIPSNFDVTKCNGSWGASSVSTSYKWITSLNVGGGISPDGSFALNAVIPSGTANLDAWAGYITQFSGSTPVIGVSCGTATPTISPWITDGPYVVYTRAAAYFSSSVAASKYSVIPGLAQWGTDCSFLGWSNATLNSLVSCSALTYSGSLIQVKADVFSPLPNLTQKANAVICVAGGSC